MSRKLSIIRGDTRSIVVTVKNSAGSTVDITGGSVFFTANATEAPTDDTEAVIQKDVTSHSDAANGESTILLTADNTDVTPGDYYYDIQYVDSGGAVSSRKQGTLEVLADTTRRTV